MRLEVYIVLLIYLWLHVFVFSNIIRDLGGIPRYTYGSC